MRRGAVGALALALAPAACQRPAAPASSAPAPATVTATAAATTPDARAAAADEGQRAGAGDDERPIDRRRPPPPDVASPPPDVETTPSGLRTRVLTAGTGARHPAATDIVEVQYTGWRKSGGFFEGTGPSERIRLDRAEIVPGLSEGIGLMVEGERRRLWVPFALAYGARPNHANAPAEDMTYDVTLLRIVPLPPTPADVGAAPSNARRSRSGLRYLPLRRGAGGAHPAPDGFVRLRETMWTPDGRLFFTSLRHADIVRWPVADLLPGVAEAIEMMVPGDRWRLWLPGALAYGERTPGESPPPFAPPRGPIIVDVVLFGVE
ncbi:MAG TPA: FKBP-type peptidyl-prolyl cis-trans isomerase [Polyangia bacterium]|nr:FKBP-type peptidyl-prolyl cis-trans isomerase [Polyangia bacterium]